MGNPDRGPDTYANGYVHAHTHSNSHSYSNVYAYANANSYSDAHIYSNSHGYSYVHAHANSDANCDSNSYAYTDSDANCDAYGPAETEPDTKATSDTAASALTLIPSDRVRASKSDIARVNYWEVLADNLSKAGWSGGCVSALDSAGRTIWIADAHRGDGHRFIVRAEEKLTGFLELEPFAREIIALPKYRIIRHNSQMLGTTITSVNISNEKERFP